MKTEIEKLREQLLSVSAKLEELEKKERLVFEKGKWYFLEDGYLMVYNNNEITYGVCSHKFRTDLRFDESYINKVKRLAAPSEIQSHLEAEAKRRGFKEGVKFRCLITNALGSMSENHMLYNGSFGGGDSLEGSFINTITNGVFYKQGKWAEITPAEEKIMIDRYDVKFYDKQWPDECVTIDGNRFGKEFWQSAKLISEHSKAKIMIGCSKQFDVSLETINKILDKLK